MSSIAATPLSRRQATLALVAAPFAPSLAAAGSLASRPAAARAQLTIVLTGGMSSQETFDPKPAAPLAHRSPAGLIATSIPGVHFSAWLPRLAARAHDFTLVRTVTLGDAPATHPAGMALLPAATVTSPAPTASSPRSIAYGTSRFGSLCRTAVERLAAGSTAECVHFAETVYDTLSWDMHANGAGLPVTLADYRDTLCPQLDRVLTALFDDLQQRDLWHRADVRVVTEVGRSPRFNARGGRDHALAPFCVLLAGSRFEGGQILGKTSPDGGEIQSNPILLPDLLAL